MPSRSQSERVEDCAIDIAMFIKNLNLLLVTAILKFDICGQAVPF